MGFILPEILKSAPYGLRNVGLSGAGRASFLGVVTTGCSSLPVGGHVQVALAGAPRSIKSAPSKRMADSRLGKMRMMRSRRRIASLSRSWPLVARSRWRYVAGNARTAVASSQPRSSVATADEAVWKESATKRASGFAG